MIARIPCELCQKDLFLRYRMLCTKCPKFFLCLNCFVERSEVPPHTQTHDMLLFPGGLPNKKANKIRTDRTTPLSKEECKTLWALDEDHFLIEGVKRLGFGNWVEISNLLRTKTPTECKQRYFTVYNIKDINNLKPNALLKKESEDYIKTLPKRLYDKRNDYGFLPHRLEFSSEYKNDTEFLLVDMGVIDHITPVLAPKLPKENAEYNNTKAVELLNSLNKLATKQKGKRSRATVKPKPPKCVNFTSEEIKEHQNKLNRFIKANNVDVINIYNDVICERHNQKNFVFNSELFWNNTHKRKRKDKDIINLLKPFRRFVNTDQEFEGIVESYALQRQIGETIADSVVSGISALSLLDPQNKQPIKEMEKMLGIPSKELEQLQNKIGSIVKQGIKKMKEPEKFGYKKHFLLKEENGKYVVEINDNDITPVNE